MGAVTARCARLLHRTILGSALLLMSLAPALSAAQPALQDIPPHLGYGVHFGPNTSISPGRVNELGMDWVKIYELGQASGFPGKRILLRVDIGWPENWAQFRADFTQRIRAIAGTPVEAVEIHNEPNLRHEWGGRTPNAWQYTQLLRVAYTVVKSVAPRLIVVSGGLAPTVTTPDRSAISDLEFAQEMFANGAGQWFDAFGYHPYGYNLPPETDPFQAQPLVFRRTERIRALMEQYGIQKQIWMTEFGWMRDPGEDGVTCSDNDPSFRGFAWMRVSGEAQADYLVRAFQFAHENWPWAGPMFVWNLNWQQMGWIEPCNHMRWFGLLRSNGEPTLAFRRLAGMRQYPSDYLPRLTLVADPLAGQVSLLCPERMPLGTFSVENLGYPMTLELSIQPVNMGAGAPFIEVEPAQARVGEKVQVFLNPEGLALVPGQYPIYINVRATVNGRPLSQTVQGSVTVWHDEFGC
jgi:hypothetical protein